jgi:polyhydroxyalkanoate synthesis regulator phasin
MTDNDIRNAIAGCVNSTVKCNECVFIDELYDGSGLCTVVALRYALDLINRQKAEVENYSNNTKTMSDSIYKMQKLIERQKAEIERLNKKVEELSEVLSDTIRIRYAECRAVAIKEFAERLKPFADADDVDTHNIIDNLVKEMVGEDK